MKSGKLPSLETVQLQEDHMGSFGDAISGVNTPETQQADNDYAVAKLVEKVANSPYKDDTLIIVARGRPAGRAGPRRRPPLDRLRRRAPTSSRVRWSRHRYTTVNVIRTIEDLLGTEHLNLNTATARPMTDVFDLNQKGWDFAAKPADVLYTTQLPLPPKQSADASRDKPAREASWYAERTVGWDWRGEDKNDADVFNRLVWEGMFGDKPYPTERTGEDLSRNRQALLAQAQASLETGQR